MTKKLIATLFSVVFASGLTLVSVTPAQAVVYSCGPSCYTDKPIGPITKY